MFSSVTDCSWVFFDNPSMRDKITSSATMASVKKDLPLESREYFKSTKVLLEKGISFMTVQRTILKRGVALPL